MTTRPAPRGLPRPKRIVMLAAAAALAITAAGCGSDDEKPSGSSTNGETKLSAQVQTELDATVEKHLKRPTSFGFTEPIKAVPKDGTLYYVYTNTPVAKEAADSAGRAAKAVGLTYKALGVKGTPESFQRGFDDALSDRETVGVIMAAVPQQVITSRLQVAKKRDIPVAVLSADAESEGNFLAVGGPKAYEANGRLQADYILSKTKGEANVLVAVPGALPTLNLTKDAFLDEWKTKCPSCKTPAVYDAPVSSLGTTFPGLLTAYLQAHREIDWVVLGFNDMVTGVPGALKAAGLNKVKATTLAQGASSNPLLGKGFLEAEVGVPVIEYGWIALDGIMRYINKQSLARNNAFLASKDDPTHWIITEAGMKAAELDPQGAWPLNPNFESEFKRLWGLTN